MLITNITCKNPKSSGKGKMARRWRLGYGISMTKSNGRAVGHRQASCLLKVWIPTTTATRMTPEEETLQVAAMTGMKTNHEHDQGKPRTRNPSELKEIQRQFLHCKAGRLRQPNLPLICSAKTSVVLPLQEELRQCRQTWPCKILVLRLRHLGPQNFSRHSHPPRLEQVGSILELSFPSSLLKWISNNSNSSRCC